MQANRDGCGRSRLRDGSSPGIAMGSVYCGSATLNCGHVGTPLATAGITMNVMADITTPGAYNIATNTVNGMSFSLGGVFSSAGMQTIALTGHGTPVVAGTFTFTVSFGNSSCTNDAHVVSNMNVPCDGFPTVSYGGQTYNTVLTGTQCWLQQNLNIGNMINSTNMQTNNGTIEKYCYENTASYCNIFGGLYQWNEVMNYTGPSSGNLSGRQGICPSGWHIPSDGEWCQLATFLEGNGSACSSGWYAPTSGGKMKQSGPPSYWSDPNTGATNVSGFTALPGGNWTSENSFFGETGFGGFWSTTGPMTYYVSYDMASLDQWGENFTSGYSVRCIRDN